MSTTDAAAMSGQLPQKSLARVADWPFIFKFLAPSGVAVAAILAIAAGGSHVLAEQAKVASSIANETLPQSLDLAHVEAEIRGINATLYGALTKQAAGATGQGEIVAALPARLDKLSADLSALAADADPSEAALFEQLISEINTYRGAMEFVTSMLEIDFASTVSYLAPFEENYAKMERIAGELVAAEVADASARSDAAADDASSLGMGFLGSAILAALVTGVLALLIGRVTTGGIARIADVTRRLARGDLDATTDGLARRDELGAVVESLVAFRANAVQVKASTDEIARLQEETARREKNVERQLNEVIGSVVEAAKMGDFSRRAPETEELGRFMHIAQGLNSVCAAAESFLESVELQAAALADGDLTRRVDINLQGRFAKVAGNLNAACDALAKTIADASESGENTRARAQNILATTGDLAERGQRQAASLEETAAAMEEMAASVKQNAANASAAAEAARAAASRADGGGALVRSAVEAVERIDATSKRVGDILGLIDGIAFQTNLLALNAAVEAARAGEMGKGFAVVAHEVRTLAHRSAEAARDVRRLIDESGQQIQVGVDLVRNTGASLAEIVAGVREVAGRIDQISTASGEQARSIGEITAAVAEMDTFTQQNSNATEGARTSAEQLAREADRLAALVSAFRTGRAVSGRSGGYSAEPRAQTRARAPVGKPRAVAGATALAEDDWSEF